MSTAYVAHGERAFLLCSYDERAGKALKKMAKLVDDLMYQNENLILQSVNISLDEDFVYNVNATITEAG